MGTPSFILRNLVQTMVYWGNPVQGGTGNISFDAPVEVLVRYEMKNELVIIHTGEEKLAGGHAWMTQDVDVGGYLYLGALDDSSLPSDMSDPREVDDTMRILVKAQFPRLGSTTQFLYRVHLNMDEE